MLDSPKLSKLKELITERERVDAEIAKLLGTTDAPKRGRPRATISEESPQQKESSDG